MNSEVDPFFSTLPDGAVITAWVGVIQFVAPDGSMAIGVSTGGASEATILGILEKAKFEFILGGPPD